MLREEAKWIGSYFASSRNEDIFPLVNIGSSTGTFRSVTQPYIDDEIFSPLAQRGGVVCHVDIKDAPGVDLVGDLEDPGFIDRIRREIQPRSLLVSNLLEHVKEPARVAEAVVAIAPPNGLIIVTGPHSYPYHPDPIDTRFRPTVDEAHELFPGTRLVTGAIISSQTWRPWRGQTGRITPALRYLARLSLPMYEPKAWRALVNSVPYAFSGVSAYVAVLAKDDRPSGHSGPRGHAP